MSHTWRQHTEAANIPITSMRALAASLQSSSIQFQGSLSFLQPLAQAEAALAKAQAHLDQMSAMSLEDVIAMEAAIEAVIAANERLHQVQQEVESVPLPQTLTFTHNGRSFTMNQVAGAYRLSWQERSLNGVRQQDQEARDFARLLSDQYRAGVARHQQERSQASRQYASLSATQRERLEQAGKIRVRWEGIQEKRRLEALVEQQVAHIEERVKNHGAGWQTEVTETDTEVIIRASVSISPSKGSSSGGSKGGFFGKGGGGFFSKG
jgi:hypothetical protein